MLLHKAVRYRNLVIYAGYFGIKTFPSVGWIGKIHREPRTRPGPAQERNDMYVFIMYYEGEGCHNPIGISEWHLPIPRPFPSGTSPLGVSFQNQFILKEFSAQPPPAIPSVGGSTPFGSHNYL